MTTTFRVQGSVQGRPLGGQLQVTLPGVHNVLNALAAVVVCGFLGHELASYAPALAEFAGVGRRSQYHGRFTWQGSTFFDLIEDYGHHPREISVTMQGMRSAWPGRRLVLVFQPHRHTRTAALWSEFCMALSTADVVMLCDIYAAGEQAIAGFSAKDMLEHLNKYPHLTLHHVTDLHSLVDDLKNILHDNDVVLMQGAGDIHGAVQQVAQEYLLDAG
jgi:UDP-N-acetylmuramate--alanine ligase